MSLSKTEPRYRPTWRRIYGYFALARISNSPTVLSNTLAGAALAGAIRPNARMVLVASAMVLFYTAGMFLNDLLDYAIDCRERPERPLPAGLVARAEAAAIVAILFGLGGAILWTVGVGPFRAGLALIALIILYDAWHKTNPLSPLIMAGNRALVYVVAFLAFAGQLTGELLAWASLLALYIVGLTAIAKSERRPSVANYWPAAALFLPGLYFVIRLPQLAALPLLLLFAGWVAYSISFVYRRQARSVGGAVGRLIAGVALLDALALAAMGATFGVVLALAAFGLTLFFQRYIKGT
jgi:4-hydroxybenzoate polyprenyltransferase